MYILHLQHYSYIYYVHIKLICAKHSFDMYIIKYKIILNVKQYILQLTQGTSQSLWIVNCKLFENE